jgi:hypothetical protein
MPSGNVPGFRSKCSGILPEFRRNFWNHCRIPRSPLFPFQSRDTKCAFKNRLRYPRLDGHHIEVELIDPQTTVPHVVFFYKELLHPMCDGIPLEFQSLLRYAKWQVLICRVFGLGLAADTLVRHLRSVHQVY